MLAALVTISGAAIGLGANLRLAGIAQQHDRDQAISEQQGETGASPDKLEQEYREQAR